MDKKIENMIHQERETNLIKKENKTNTDSKRISTNYLGVVAQHNPLFALRICNCSLELI